MADPITRRQILTVGSLTVAASAAASLFDSPLLLAQAAANSRKDKPVVIDVHAHLWTDEYLDLVESYGKKDKYPQIPEKPSLAARRMWYDTVNYGDVPSLRAAVEKLGAGQLVLGSDFPYENGDLYRLAVNYIRGAGLPPQEVARILARNASAVLGLA